MYWDFQHLWKQGLRHGALRGTTDISKGPLLVNWNGVGGSTLNAACLEPLQRTGPGGARTLRLHVSLPIGRRPRGPREDGQESVSRWRPQTFS